MSNNIFSYTHRDYESSRKEGLSKIPLISKGNWTDLNATDPGIIILDYVHALVDMLSYYQDHQALEAFLPTAKERSSLFRLAKQLSYNIRSAKGAICEVEFTSPVIYQRRITIPKYTKLSTVSGVNYITTEEAYLVPPSDREAGDVQYHHRVIVPCVQGDRVSTTYKGTGESRFSSTGAVNQSIRLANTNIDIDSVEVIDNLGYTWKPIDYIVFSNPTDRVYQIELNPDNSISIKFGDGERGAVPKDTDIFTINYITSLAEEGRVGRNEITVLVDTIFDDDGHYIDLIVNNNKASTGGSSAQSSREIRELAPGAIKSQDRAVTLSDFENLARLVDGVADAKAYDVNLDDSLEHHEVKVLIIPEDYQGSTEILTNIVSEYLSQRMIPPTNLDVITPSSETIDIEVNVKKLDNVSKERLYYSIETTIKDYFKLKEREIGGVYYPSELSNLIYNLEGVRVVLSITPNTIIDSGKYSVLRLGNLKINIE